MRSRYDGNPGKESAIANKRQSRLQAEHSHNNSFVKSSQNAVSRYAGKKPDLKADLMEFNAEMQNSGDWAQGLGKKLTAGIDNVAFPVDGSRDDS